jgi:peptide/nickel transport system substrate-binding protein
MKKSVESGEDRSGFSYENIGHNDRALLQRALKRGINRRDALSMLLAGGLSVAAAGKIVTAAGKALAATPKKGGKVKAAVDLHGPSDTLDPGLGTSDIDYTRFRAHYNSLIQLNDDLLPQPELAEEFSANDDGTVWSFKLRKDVEWHDGSKFTADDVIYSMGRHYGKKSTSVVKTLVQGVKEWKKVDAYTVKAIQESPNVDLPAVLGEKQLKIVKDGTTDFSNPVGTGPYTLKDFKPGVRSLHVRNKNYWRDGPNLDEIEIFAITDSVARLNALLSGDIDMMVGLSPKAVKHIKSSGRIKVLSTPAGIYMGTCIMLDRAPGNNPDFVKGMKLLQRREKIVRSVLKGYGTVGNDQPINEAYGVDFCRDLPIRPHDPDQAKFHLKKSGITSAELHVAEVRPGITDVSLLWQQECSKIGFDLKIKKVPNDGYWGAVWMKTPMNVVTWNQRPTATMMLDIAFAPNAPWNDTVWKDERMGKLLKMAKAEFQAGKRHELLCEMQKLVHENSGVIIPCHTNYLDAVAKDIMGVPKLSIGSLGGSEWPEFVWRA